MQTRTRIRVFVLVFTLAIIAVGLTTATILDWLYPIGPADFRVQWMTHWELRKDLGPSQKTGMKILSYTHDKSGGLYKVSYYHDQQHGDIYWQYDDRSGGLSFVKIEQNGK